MLGPWLFFFSHFYPTLPLCSFFSPQPHFDDLLPSSRFSQEVRPNLAIMGVVLAIHGALTYTLPMVLPPIKSCLWSFVTVTLLSPKRPESEQRSDEMASSQGHGHKYVRIQIH